MNKQTKLHTNTLTQKNKIITASIILIITLIMLLPATTNAQDLLSYTAAIHFPDPFDTGNEDLDIISFEYAEQNQGADFGRGATRVEMADIVVTRYVDEFSPWFFLKCADGSHIDEVWVYLYTGAGPLPVPPGQIPLEIRLWDVTVTSYSLIGETGDEAPKEVFTLGYNRIEYRVGIARSGWDLVKNNQI